MWWERIKAARSAFSLVGAAMHPLKTFLWTGRLKFVFFPRDRGGTDFSIAR